MRPPLARLPLAALLLALAACGGGGGGSGNGGPRGGSGNYVPGNFQPSSSFAARCMAPRSGTNPATGRPYPDVTGTQADQNNWLRSWTNELYLWYREVPDLNPASYATDAYFELLKTSATTATGADKDRFHFTYPTPVWQALATSGEEVGYGLRWVLLATRPPRRAVVAFVEPNAPASTVASAVSRGYEVTTVDGVDLVNVNTQSGVDALNAGLFPDTAGEVHTFNMKDLDGVNHLVTLTSATVITPPTPLVDVIPTDTGPVGYMVFNDHIATAERALFDAITSLKASAITDLILDIRYNGGGYLDIASELAYMVAGNVPTAGRTFELLQFNDKYPNTNPVTGGAITPEPFLTRSQGFSSTLAAGTQFPTLNLPRVFVLTGSNTCSASESIINGLRGVDVQVIQIGSTTCGKPFGFSPADNCGTTYFSIQFRGVNAKSFGGYEDGFVPSITDDAQARVKGCTVADDFTHELGDLEEHRLLTALAYRESGACVALATGRVGPLGLAPLSATEGVMPKSPWRTNRILRQE